MNASFHAKLILAGLLTTLPLTAASGQSFPSRPLTLIVATAAGSVSDAVARLLSDRMQQRLGQNVVVQNQPGAGGLLAAAQVARGSPDGHQLLVLTTGIPFDRRDFRPVGMVAKAPIVLVVRTSGDVGTMRDLVERAKARPDSLKVADAGGYSAVASSLLQSAASVRFTMVPYRAQAEALQDLVGGRIDALFATYQPVSGLVKNGSLKALAVMSPGRSPLLPNVPTMKDAGVPVPSLEYWVGLVAPASTPPGAIDALKKALQEVVGSTQVTAALQQMGLTAAFAPPEDFAKSVNQSGGTPNCGATCPSGCSKCEKQGQQQCCVNRYEPMPE